MNEENSDTPPWVIQIPERTAEEQRELIAFMLGDEFADRWMAGKDHIPDGPHVRMVMWDEENQRWIPPEISDEH